MRTHEQIEKIKSTFSDPYSVDDFISQDEINYLIDLFEKAESKNAPLVYKNTGPITLDLNFLDGDLVLKNIFDKIESQIGKFEITAAFFFRTDYPHIIHNDDTFELPDNVYKGINLPLKLEAERFIDYPKLCFFDQHYYQGPSKFFNGDSDIPTYYNKQVYKYDEIDQLSETSIDNQTYAKYFTHLKPQWLQGLSLDRCIDWKPGSAIIFDSLRLHCASDFRRLGIKSKLAISIFTKKL